MFPPPRIDPERGFTLIELLVALSLMAVMAVMSWQGLDGMTRAQEQTRQHSNEVLALQMGLAQWTADLDALAPVPQTPSIDWDGRVLRLTRYNSASPTEGLLVVAWSRRLVNSTGQWLRWQSPAVRTRSELQDAWQQATLWAQNPGPEQKKREVAVAPLEQWQFFFYRQNAWTNPLSSDTGTLPSSTTGTALSSTPGTAPSSSDTGTAAPANSGIPDGVRLVLTLPSSSALGGVITRDWARPNLGGNKS
jgi:general secretion pathway protein J